MLACLLVHMHMLVLVHMHMWICGRWTMCDSPLNGTLTRNPGAAQPLMKPPLLGPDTRRSAKPQHKSLTRSPNRTSANTHTYPTRYLYAPPPLPPYHHHTHPPPPARRYGAALLEPRISHLRDHSGGYAEAAAACRVVWQVGLGPKHAQPKPRLEPKPTPKPKPKPVPRTLPSAPCPQPSAP